jgi:HK97 gp10 family phage protein
MNFEIEGLEEFIKSLDETSKNYDKNAKKTLNSIGMKLKAKTVLKTPVDTGVLRRSWTYKTKNANEGILSNSTRYSSYVEYGHRTKGGKSFVNGRYMLTKSIEEVKNEIDDDLGIVINDLFK